MVTDIHNYMSEINCIELQDHTALDAKFLAITSTFKPDIICDIGSRDGEVASKMKKLSPKSEVFAFEPNPENFFEFAALSAAGGVNFLPIAIGASDSITALHLPPYATKYASASLPKRGIGSLRRRNGEMDSIEYVATQMRLSSFFQLPEHKSSSFQLWIDVEGASYDAISGIDSWILANTVAIKVEVETMEVWEGQRTFKDVIDILTLNGLEPKYWFYHDVQFDIVFLNNSINANG